MAEKKRYTLAQFVFKDVEITAESFKVTISQEITTYNAFNSHTPFAKTVTKESYEWELSGIDPLQRSVFEEAMALQKSDLNNLPSIATYDYDEVTGDLVEDDVFFGCVITEISKESGAAFGVKGEATKKKPKIQS